MASSGGSVRNPDFTSQLRFMVEWFTNFSTLQKNDFLPILVEQFNAEKKYNGLPPVSSDEGPSEAAMPSIFECRVKLIIRWTSTWTNSQKWDYINRIRELDEEFVNEFLAQCNIEPEPEEN